MLGIGTAEITVGTPLLITLGVFLLSSLYVFFGVPRIRAAALARRGSTRRRPRKEVPSVDAGQ